MERNWADYKESCRANTEALHAAVLTAALHAARENGLQRIRRDDIARRAGVAMGTVNNAFGNMQGLRAAVLREAIDKEHLDVLAQGLAIRDPIALEAPQPLKVRALATLTV